MSWGRECRSERKRIRVANLLDQKPFCYPRTFNRNSLIEMMCAY